MPLSLRAVTLPESQNRECHTVQVTTDVGGFQYGMNVIVARKTLTAENIPDSLAVFDEQIHEQLAYSSYGMISTTDNGIQNGTTFCAYLSHLHVQLKKRGVTFPVMLLSDDHSSRSTDEVVALAEQLEIDIGDVQYYHSLPTAHFY
jgi:hypothetical protein